MLFKKDVTKMTRAGTFLIFAVLVTIQGVEARVDRTIQKAFEQLYEDKVFIVREDLVSFSPGQRRHTFETDLYSFIYEDTEDDRRVIFPKGTRVLIEKVDFDKETIGIEFESVDGRQKGEVVFDFGDNLSEVFSEKRGFTSRYDEIFLPEELKNQPVFTDTISTIIESGAIKPGDSTEDLFLTLGDPSDIVKRVSAAASIEEWWYSEGHTTYQFIFEDDELQEWITHQERDEDGGTAFFQTNRL